MLSTKIFREPKSTNQVDEVLKNYSKTITTSSSSNSKVTGALLFSVIGNIYFCANKIVRFTT